MKRMEKSEDYATLRADILNRIDSKFGTDVPRYIEASLVNKVHWDGEGVVRILKKETIPIYRQGRSGKRKLVAEIDVVYNELGSEYDEMPENWRPEIAFVSDVRINRGFGRRAVEEMLLKDGESMAEYSVGLDSTEALHKYLGRSDEMAEAMNYWSHSNDNDETPLEHIKRMLECKFQNSHLTYNRFGKGGANYFMEPVPIDESDSQAEIFSHS